MNNEFDLIVIGAGPGGENAAGRAADAGLAIAIVKAELVGGECSFWGCIPSKAATHRASMVKLASRTHE